MTDTTQDPLYRGLIDLLIDWLEGRPELKRTFALWIRALLLVTRDQGFPAPPPWLW